MQLSLKSAKVMAILALFAALLSFAKFQHCRTSGWGAPDVYVHMCYSDLSALYGARDMNVDAWPYSSPDNSVEYPVVTGLVMWGTALLIDDPNGYRAYFDINAFLTLLLFIGAVLVLFRLRQEFAYLFIFAPAVIASLYINWDLWAVLGSLIAIYFLRAGRYEVSALALGLAIATKFFPIALLLPITLHLLRNRNLKKLSLYLFVTLATWLLINVPIAISNLEGWSRFFKLNLERNNDLGSIWYAFNLLGIEFQLNWLSSILLVLLGVLGIIWIYLKKLNQLDQFQSFAIVSFFAISLFVTISKVYSPQYVLWLTPLAISAINSKRDLSAFWIWQGGEALYHFAIWQYLASYTGAKFGLPENFYALAIFIRVATLLWFCASLVKNSSPTRSPNPQPLAAISR